MATSIIGGSGYQKGVEAAETGINCESFSVRYFPFVDERLNGITGEPVVRARSTAWSREVSVSGEVNGSSGLLAFTINGACTFGNDVADFGGTTGTLLMNDSTITQTRDGWRSLSASYSSDPLVVV
jgi:hypothetical protein